MTMAWVIEGERREFLYGINSWSLQLRCLLLRSLLFFTTLHSLSLTSPRRSSLLPEGGTYRFCPHIASDSYLHRSVLSRQLRSSSYSSVSITFSLVPCWRVPLIRAGVTWPVRTLSFYINRSTSCITSLTLTYLILPRIYQGHCSLPRISLSPRRTIESTLLWTLWTPSVRLDARTPKERLLGRSHDQSSLRLYLPGPSVTLTTLCRCGFLLWRKQSSISWISFGMDPSHLPWLR